MSQTQRPLLAAFVVALLFLLLYVAPLGLRPMLIPDEARYAQIPREMIQNDTWLVPQFAGMPYFEKPSGGYWPQIAVQKLFGESPFGVRLPYVFAAALTLLLTWLLARRVPSQTQNENRFRGLPLYSVLTLMVMGEFFIISTTAVLDGLFTAFVTGTLVFFYLAWSEMPGRRHMLKTFFWLMLCGMSAGCAFIIKGFLAFALPGIAILAFLIWVRDWKSIFLKPWVPLFGAMVILLPWAVETAERAPEFWIYFIVVEHYQRFFQEVSSQHPEPFYYFIPVLLAGAMPFTLFCVPLFCGGKTLPWKTNPLLKYCAVWIILPFLLLSLSKGKLATYILPLFPPIAILCAFSMLAADGKEKLARYFSLTVKIVVPLLGIALFVFLVINYTVLPLYGKEQIWLVLGTSLCVILFLFVLWSARKERSVKNQYLLLVIAMFFLMPVWQLGLPRIVINQKAPAEFLKESYAKIPENAIVMTREQFMGILMWTTGKKDFLVFYKPGELEYGIKNSIDGDQRFVSVEKFKEMLADPASRKNRPIAIYLTSNHEKRYNTLPQFKKVLATNGQISLMLFE